MRVRSYGAVDTDRGYGGRGAGMLFEVIRQLGSGYIVGCRRVRLGGHDVVKIVRSDLAT